MRSIGCPETSVTINLRCVTFQKRKDLIYTARPKNQGVILADREEVASLPSQQAVNLQNGAETYLDI